MAVKPWQERYHDKLASPHEALSRLSNGFTIFLGSGVGEPCLLTETLAEMAPQFRDIEVIHLVSLQRKTNLARKELAGSFRYNTFYMGQGSAFLSGSITENGFTGEVKDFTPMDISEIPIGLAEGVIAVDAVLVQVSPPDDSGFCSLGVSVDATLAAVENCDLVIAQVNEEMPVTMGDSLIPTDEIKLFVEGTRPLSVVEPPQLDPVSLTIGRHIAELVEDGATLHFGQGPISAATIRYLDTKKDLGIHTEVITADILRLIRSQAVTNRLKRTHRGKTTATMAMGTAELYKALDKNPYIELYPINEISDPFAIAQNDNMVSIHAVEEIELTGMARIDSQTAARSDALSSSINFLEGARHSKNGIAILALPSTTEDGSGSRIVTTSSGRGVFFSRAKVDYVVTEYGVVNLYGMTVRERAIALIHIAHPKFRKGLLEQAKLLGYVEEGQIIPPEKGSVYPFHYIFKHKLKDGREVLFRPVRPDDAKRLQKMFYALSDSDKRMRYHGTTKALSNETAQRIAAVDYSQDIAIVGEFGNPRNPRIIAEGRYMYNPANNMGEFDIMVDNEFRGAGIGKLLSNYLSKIAYARGLAGVYAEVIGRNTATISLLEHAWPKAVCSFDEGGCRFTLKFPPLDVSKPKDSIVIYSGRFADFSYGTDHPFDPSRARTVVKLMRSNGYLNEPWIREEEPELVTKERLYESHDPAFIEALAQASSGEWDEKFLRYGLGGSECPIFPGLFEYVLLYTSATLTGVDCILQQNANIVFNPLGGFHHASRRGAEGFCYVNDAIAAIDRFLAHGFRVAYLDLDAHHGNGVQDAYYNDDRVLTVSLHESGKTLYPWTGFETEIGEDNGRGFNINVPLPEETDDEAFTEVFDAVVSPAINIFAPSVVVTVIGADTHKADPLSHLSLTNNGMVTAIEKVRNYSNHLLLLGGGGYDHQSVTRAWARIWAAANRIDALPDYLLMMGGTFLGDEDLSGAELIDMAYRVSGEKKEAIRKELERIAKYHKEHTFPLLSKRSVTWQ